MTLVSVHLVNLLLVNLMDREPLELEAGAELAPGHSELSDWSIVTMKAFDWSIAHLGAMAYGPPLCQAYGPLIGLVNTLVNQTNILPFLFLGLHNKRL